MSAAGRGSKRRPSDDYQTPPELARAFIELIDWDRVRSVMEPARGAGAFYDSFPVGVQRHWCEIEPGYTAFYGGGTVDYLGCALGDVPYTDATITNPPFSHATRFILRALASSKLVAMLLPFSIWGSSARYDFWRSIPPPTHQVAITPRPSFVPHGGSDSNEYCFLCWDYIGAMRCVQPFDVLRWDNAPARARATAERRRLRAAAAAS